ncbi:unnamed protein product, partial [Prorocentrum cordatum]
MADPAAVVGIFKLVGLPRSTADLGRVLADPCAVDASMPQGDGWSVVGMTALLVAPLTKLQEEFLGTQQAAYMDDRSWKSATAEMAEVASSWRRWSAALGLKENRSKEQLGHRTEAGRRQLKAQAEVAESTVLAQPLMLGCHLQPAR